MICGAGDIAQSLLDRKGALMFASGVSNSACVDTEQFDREKELLLSMPKNMSIFYFSSISIYYKSNPYQLHKIRMENIIRSNWNNYNIIRLGNIDFGTNPNTFINFLKAKKAKGEPYELLDEWRYLIGQDELILLTQSLPVTGQNEINVFSRMVKPAQVI